MLPGAGYRRPGSERCVWAVGVGSASSGLWDLQGNAMVMTQYIRLTPDLQSKQGAVWNRVVSPGSSGGTPGGRLGGGRRRGVTPVGMGWVGKVWGIRIKFGVLGGFGDDQGVWGGPEFEIGEFGVWVHGWDWEGGLGSWGRGFGVLGKGVWGRVTGQLWAKKGGVWGSRAVGVRGFWGDWGISN